MRAGHIRDKIKSIADWARPSLFPAAIAATVILVAGHAYERQNERLYRNELHARVATELSLIGARLEGEINKDVAALQGLANLFAAALSYRPRAFFEAHAKDRRPEGAPAPAGH